MPPIDRPRAVDRELALALALVITLLVSSGALAQSSERPLEPFGAPAGPSRFTERLTLDGALERVDTSSPRAVLISLLGITDRIGELTADQGYTWQNWPEIESLETQLTKLFDLREDQAEKNNLIGTRPELAGKLDRELRAWQQSVLESLTGADYRSPRKAGEK